MVQRPYFATKTDGDESGKKATLYALGYVAIGVVVNLALFLSNLGILTAACTSVACPTIVELMVNVILKPEFWLNVIIWPLKLTAFLWRSI